MTWPTRAALRARIRLARRGWPDSGGRPRTAPVDGGVRRAQVDTAAVAILEASTTSAQAAQQATDVLTLRYETGAEGLVSVTDAALVDAQLSQASAQIALQRVRYQVAWTTPNCKTLANGSSSVFPGD